MVSRSSPRVVLGLVFSTFKAGLHGKSSEYVVGGGVKTASGVHSFCRLHPILVFRVSNARVLKVRIEFRDGGAICRLLLKRLRARGDRNRVFAGHRVLNGVRCGNDFSRKESDYSRCGVKHIRAKDLVVRVRGSNQGPNGKTLRLKDLLGVTSYVRRGLLSQRVVTTVYSLRGVGRLFLKFLGCNFHAILFRVANVNGFFHDPCRPARGYLFTCSVNVMFRVN